jgi:hypothetical protein
MVALQNRSLKMVPPLQRIMQDGARLRTRLLAYIAQRRAILDAHCSLLPPLRDLVHGYEEPTTTDELWAMGLGDLPALCLLLPAPSVCPGPVPLVVSALLPPALPLLLSPLPSLCSPTQSHQLSSTSPCLGAPLRDHSGRCSADPSRACSAGSGRSRSC